MSNDGATRGAEDLVTAAPLGREEIERYARHLVLREIGGAGQQRLKCGSVLVIGAGGLGSAAIQYLAAAGVGRIGIVDDDVVSLSNLQRQVIHGTGDIGWPKAASAAESVERLNPHVRVATHRLRFGTESGALVETYDVVIDASDNAPTRLFIADACEAARRPLVSAAIGAFDGSLTVLMPYAAGPDGRPLPRLRDLYPDLPAAGDLPTCAETGVLGALAGVVGALQASEAVKLLTGAGEPLVGRLLLVDLLGMRFETISYGRV
jgi:molybdopterin/thiamine biosynthesis adenylyltransferase